MNVFAIPLIIFLVLILFIYNVYYVLKIKDTKKRKKYILLRTIFYILLTVILFLFGPLFIYSPIKIGYKTKEVNESNFVYPVKFTIHGKYDDNNFERVLYDIYHGLTYYHLDLYFENEYPTQFLFVNSKTEMMRLGGNVVGGSGAMGLGGTIILLFDQFNDPIASSELVHELTHFYLYKNTNKGASFFPRWFDEGLATYISNGGNQRITEYMVSSNVNKWMENSKYESDLSHWDGFIGYLRWQFYDARNKPYESYLQSAYLISYLIREKGGETNIKSLINECRKSHSFKKAFYEIYGQDLESFHSDFIKQSKNIL